MSKRHPRNYSDPTANTAIKHIRTRPAVSWPGKEKEQLSAATVLKVARTLRERYPSEFEGLDVAGTHTLALRIWDSADRDLDTVTLDHVRAAKAADAGRGR